MKICFMEKIMLAVNAVDLDKNSLELACSLAKMSNSVLTGLFLENLAKDKELVIKNVYEGTYIGLEVDRTSSEYTKKNAEIEANIEVFNQTCQKNGVRSNVQRDEERPVAEVIGESRYADLLISDGGLHFKKAMRHIPSAIARRILRNVACPVIVSTGPVQEIREMVFAYDGSASAMFAIKQFTYLFPEFSSHKLCVVNVNDREGAIIMVPDQLKEWLEAHYTSFVFEELHGKREGIFLDYLAEKKNAIIIMGAYGRSRVSRLLRTVAADLYVDKIALPFFVAHQ